VVEAPGPPVRGACDSEGLPDDHRAVRRGALAERSQRPRPVADRALLLGLQPDEEARAVDEMDERQVECAREVDETRDLLRGRSGPRAAVDVGILGEQRDGPAVEASEAADDRLAPLPPDLEERRGAV